jgi:hypothetical protein
VVVSSKRWAYSAAIILTAGLLSHNSTKKDEPNKKRRQLFEPLHDADNPSKVNKISVIIHPLPRL